jgi:DNA-binding NtrC family response regulator
VAPHGRIPPVIEGFTAHAAKDFPARARGYIVQGRTRPGDPRQLIEWIPVKKNILVIDDEKMFCLLLKKFLEKRGYNVKAVFSGADVVDQLWEKKYALVISDICMSEINGIEVLQKIRIAYPSTPVMMMSGNASSVALEQIKHFNAQKFIQKPFELRALLAEVEAIIGPGELDVEPPPASA